MPQKITCDRCDEIFYEGSDLKAPEEIIKKLDGVCPKCGKTLSFDPKKVEIHILDQKRKRRR